MKTLVYIAGPFGPGNGMTMEENTFFAERVGKYAQELGYAPVVPHSSILRGVYGDDTKPEERVEGTLSTLSLMMAVMESPRSELWVITDELGGMSEGTKEEYDIWYSNRGSPSIRIAKAQEWKRQMRKQENK